MGENHRGRARIIGRFDETRVEREGSIFTIRMFIYREFLTPVLYANFFCFERRYVQQRNTRNKL